MLKFGWPTKHWLDLLVRHDTLRRYIPTLAAAGGNLAGSLSRNLEKACRSRFRDEFFVEQEFALFTLCDRCVAVIAGGEREGPALRPHEQPDHPRHDEGEEA